MNKFVQKSFLLTIIVSYTIQTEEDLVSESCRRPNTTQYYYELEDCKRWTSSFADGKKVLQNFRFRSIFLQFYTIFGFHFNPFREFVSDLIQKGRLPQGCIWFKSILGAFINYALGFKKTKNKIKFDFFLPFYFIFEFGFNQTTRVSQIHLESKILIFVTKLRPRLP